MQTIRRLTTEEKANARQIVRFLMSSPDAFPKKSAAAVCGNGGVENRMRPVTTGRKDHGSDGLLQWRLDRLDELKRKFPETWNTLEAQCKFFKIECKRDYPELWSQLLNPGTRSTANLTANICKFYERPNMAVANLDQRIAFAEEVEALTDIPPVLQPAVNAAMKGVGSSSLGGAALTLAYYLYTNHAGWPITLLAAILGLGLIFFVGPTSSQPPTQPPGVGDEPPADSSSPSEKIDMDPVAIARFLQIIEAFEPVMEKLVTRIGSLEQRIGGLETQAQPGAHLAPHEDRFNTLINQLNELVNKLGNTNATPPGPNP